MRYYLPFAALLLLFSVSVNTQAQKKELRKANSAYEAEEYYYSTVYYKQATELGAVLGLDDKKQLARAYFFINKIGDAFEIYEPIHDDLSDLDIFYYAQVLHRFGLYEDAIEWYDKAKKTGEFPDGVTVLHVNEMIECCRWAEANQSSYADYIVNPEGALVNMGQSFGIQILGDKIVYSYGSPENQNKDRTGNPFLNLYVSDLEDYRVVAGSSRVFSQNLIFPYHVGAISFTSDKKHMFITKTVYVDKIPMLKIYVLDYDGSDWVNERVIEFDNDDFDFAHPCVSPDDKYLYFVSNMPNNTKFYGKSVRNFGGKDIYRAQFSSDVNHFSKVENLGDEINTYGDEVYPVINPDGCLYFSSNARKGFGGLDIFAAEQIDGKWQNARNILKPFNTNVDDFSYVMFPDNQDYGFLSSNNVDGYGEDKIWYVKKKEVTSQVAVEAPPVFGADGLIFDGESLDAVNVSQQLEEPVVDSQPVEPVQESVSAPLMVDLATSVSSTYNNEIISGARIVIRDEESDSQIASVSTGVDGKASLQLSSSDVSGDNEVIIVISKEGFNEKTVQASKDELTAMCKEGFKLTPIFNDQVLDDISGMSVQYDNDLDDNAKSTLDKLAAYLLQNPSITVKLNGHTEAKGNRYQNLTISTQMAEKAKAYVVSKGVNPDQLIPRGYGERYLLNRCHRGVYCDASMHKINRRIEVVVWKVAK